MEGVEGLEFGVELLAGGGWVGDCFAGGVEVEGVLGEEVDCGHGGCCLLVLNSCRDVVLRWSIGGILLNLCVKKYGGPAPEMGSR